jgi:hypothetical protein
VKAEASENTALGEIWRFIEIVATHPFEAAVIAFSAFFVLSIMALLGIERWRANVDYYKRTGLLIGQLPPPKDR